MRFYVYVTTAYLVGLLADIVAAYHLPFWADLTFVALVMVLYLFGNRSYDRQIKDAYIRGQFVGLGAGVKAIRDGADYVTVPVDDDRK